MSLTKLIQRHGNLLRKLNGGSSGKGPGCPVLQVCGNLLFVLIAQEEEGETHGGEVKLLQEPGRFFKPGEKHPTSVIKTCFGNKGLQRVK